MTFTYPPATEEQIAATERRLGFPLPSLLRRLYREVANGGNGLVWYDESFPFFGVEGGCPAPPLGFRDAALWRADATIGELVSHSSWRLHPCIEDALRRYPHCYVVCDALPGRFISLSYEGPGVSALDMESGRIYRADFEGELVTEADAPRTLISLRFYKESLAHWLEEWLEMSGCAASTSPAEEPHDHHSIPHTELTADLLDPACGDAPMEVWRGLYRGTYALLNPEEPEEGGI